MFNILFFVACFAKQKIEYIPIGVVDSADNGVCAVEIYEKNISPNSTTVYIYSNNCKDGDIITVARKK